jgi:uracil-DNA glycosylase family 4
VKDLSREFLEEAWSTAKNKLPGWAYAALLTEARARTGGKVRGAISRARQAQLMRHAMNVIKDGGDGVIIAFKIPEEIAAKIAQKGGEKPEDLHVTLAYLGSRSAWSEDELKVLCNTIAEHAKGTTPLIGKISGSGKFSESGAVYASVDVPQLSTFRERIVNALDAAAISVNEYHGFDPHITLQWEGDPLELPPLEFGLSSLCVYAGDERFETTLDGVPHAMDIPNARDATPAASHQRQNNPDRDENKGEAKQASKAIAKSEVPAVGPEGAVLFVGGSPMAIDRVRGEPFSGPVGETINERYLKPLGLTRAEVAFIHAVPVVCKSEDERAAMLEWRPWLLEEIKRLKPKAVVALGRIAKQALGDHADFRLPHPALVRVTKEADAEVGRKLKAIRKKLDARDNSATLLRILFPEPHGAQASAARIGAKADPKRIQIAKADESKKHVYGVVLDPYVVDAHNDWIPPKVIDDTAEKFMTDYRMISAHHMKATDAQVVSSFVEEYPSKDDRAKAWAGEPHRVYRRKFGDDYLHSGAWVLGVKLPDDLWERFLRGEFEAFSIEGFATKTKVSPQTMPKVDVVDLVPSHDL